MTFSPLDLDMGKYAFFVWGAYGASALALGGLVLTSLRVRAYRLKVLTALQTATATTVESHSEGQA